MFAAKVARPSLAGRRAIHTSRGVMAEATAPTFDEVESRLNSGSSLKQIHQEWKSALEKEHASFEQMTPAQQREAQERQFRRMQDYSHAFKWDKELDGAFNRIIGKQKEIMSHNPLNEAKVAEPNWEFWKSNLDPLYPQVPNFTQKIRRVHNHFQNRLKQEHQKEVQKIEEADKTNQIAVEEVDKMFNKVASLQAYVHEKIEAFKRDNDELERMTVSEYLAKHDDIRQQIIQRWENNEWEVSEWDAEEEEKTDEQLLEESMQKNGPWDGGKKYITDEFWSLEKELPSTK